MRPVQSFDTSRLFTSSAAQSAQLESLSQGALSKGIDLYMRKDYEGAVREFKRSIGLGRSIRSPFTVDAAHYMANAHKKLGQHDKALEAYRTAIEIDDQREDSHVYLGNLCIAMERFGDAEKAYAAAVELNPSDNNHFSLGQAYMLNGRYRQAEQQFNKVLSIDREKPNGNFALGQLYSREKRYDEAVAQFDRAIEKQPDFYDAHAEKGYALADAGRIEEAREIVTLLENADQDLATMLEIYLNKVEPPRIEFAYGTSSFFYKMPPRSKVSALDDYLANANTSKQFFIEFQFGKKMDISSVMNRFNWQITRSQGAGTGEQYNFGLSVPETEASVALFPDRIAYDPVNYAARVYLTISQNATADATIDPSHLTFKFSGKDASGIPMDENADEFNGYSRVH